MSYNRWMPRKYYSGGELYHYGVKGMKWKNHTYAQRPDQNGSSGGAAYDPEHPYPGSFAEEEAKNTYDSLALYRASLKYKEARKPAWQKKWEKSSVKQAVDKIIEKIKGGGKSNRPRSRKRNKSSNGKGVVLRKKAFGGELRVE